MNFYHQLAVTMADRWGDHHTLTYRLYDSDLVERWRVITGRLLAQSSEIKTVWYNRTQADLPDIEHELRSLVSEIDGVYDREITCAAVIDREELNRLHTEFELFDQRLRQQHLPLQVCQMFIRLNELIHQCEDAAQNKTHGKTGSYSCLYDLGSGREFYRLQQRDLMLLEAEPQWGGLYLGYATVGKDWLAVYLDRDLALIEQDQVTAQQRFSAETWLCFNTGQPRHTHTSKFQSWAGQLPEALRSRIPLDDIAALRFGKIKLGEIIIDDQFLGYDPDPWHWQAQGHPCRLLWNRCVFAQMRSIVSIHID
jgi:hypothetical protein